MGVSVLCLNAERSLSGCLGWLCRTKRFAVTRCRWNTEAPSKRKREENANAGHRGSYVIGVVLVEHRG